MDMFEKAARLGLRFESSRGVLSVEDLWDLSVQSLDAIYKSLNREVKSATEDSLLQTRSRQEDILELKVNIVKHVVSVKLEEAEARKSAAERKAKKEKLLEILANKQDAALQELSPDDLQKMIAELEE